MPNNAIEILRRTTANKYSRWSFQDASKNQNPDLAVNRLYRGKFVFEWRPKFSIGRSDKIFTVGSCFAREIESALAKSNMSVLTRLAEIENNDLFALRPGVSSIHDFFNRYNLGSMCQEFESLTSAIPLASSDHLIYQAIDGGFDDLHYTPAALSVGVDQIRRRRSFLHKHLSKALLDSDVVIITLGLTEALYDTDSGMYLNVVSSPQMLRRNSEKLDLRVIGYEENARFLDRIVSMINHIGQKKIICTVSPVPLEVTFSGDDIVIANHVAKSTLRVVAEEARKKYSNVDYFPSYEIATFSGPDIVWKADRRHIQENMINYITTTALDGYVRN